MSSSYLTVTTEEEHNIQEKAEIDMSVFEDAVVEVEDSSADFSAPQEPLPAGKYLIKFRLDDKMIENPDKMLDISTGGRNSKGGKPYIKLSLIGQVVDADGNELGHTIYHNANSLVFSNQKNSEVHAILHALGHTVPNTIHLVKDMEGRPSLRTVILNVFGTEPVGLFPLEWKVAVREVDGSWTDIHKSMAEFPRLEDAEDGTPQYKCSIEHNGKTVYARNYIHRNWMSVK